MRMSIRAAGRVFGVAVGLVALPVAALADTPGDDQGEGVSVNVDIAPTDGPSATTGPTGPADPTPQPTGSTGEPGGVTVPADDPTSGAPDELERTGFGGTPLLLAAAGLLAAGVGTALSARRRRHRG